MTQLKQSSQQIETLLFLIDNLEISPTCTASYSYKFIFWQHHCYAKHIALRYFGDGMSQISCSTLASLLGIRKAGLKQHRSLGL